MLLTRNTFNSHISYCCTLQPALALMSNLSSIHFPSNEWMEGQTKLHRPRRQHVEREAASAAGCRSVPIPRHYWRCPSSSGLLPGFFGWQDSASGGALFSSEHTLDFSYEVGPWGRSYTMSLITITNACTKILSGLLSMPILESELPLQELSFPVNFNSLLIMILSGS